MRNATCLCALLVAALYVPLAGQDRPRDPNKPPDKGSTITVKGCVVGSSSIHDAGSGLTYRLKGKKDFLKMLGEEHKGHVDELTGVLQTNMRMGGVAGKRIGNTTVTIGAAESMNSPMTPREINPILEVKSIEHLGLPCTK